LPQDKKLILFGAMSSTSDKRKGFHLLQNALHKFTQLDARRNTEVIVFGHTEQETFADFGLKVHYFGQLHDEVSIKLLNGAADAFVAPSIQENLSNMVVEALACGVPCIAFDIGGMPDMIEHKKNGYLAQAYDSEDLAHGIFWVLTDKDRLKKLSKAARQKAVNEFSIGLIANRYRKLYEEISKKNS
jgi:glycosyltransferase involved in cell wall biosynthesis